MGEHVLSARLELSLLIYLKICALLQLGHTPCINKSKSSMLRFQRARITLVSSSNKVSI